MDDWRSRERRASKERRRGRLYASDAAARPFAIPLVGRVRGEVRVLNGDAQERIPLGDFKVDRGASCVVTLSTGRTELEFDPAVKTTDEFLTATLQPPTTIEGRKQWKLVVEMKPDAPAHDLGAHAAVTLQMKVNGQETRKLRIPVTGNAHR